jgi:ABC-2 type transport system ATP-binding protein
MIQVKSLRVDYEGVTAVRDLDVVVSKGQIFGLVGPNGAGKTSTLKAIAGIITPTYGDIVIDGIDLDLDHQRAQRCVGFMPDFPPVYEQLTVGEYLEVFAAAYFCPRRERRDRTRFWARRVHLEEKWDATVQTLSRGMRQRLVLAKTLLHDPKVLLLDEPASGLDPIGRVEMRNILKEVAATGKTVIISSHILTELSDLCNAVGIMEQGVMVISGTVDEIRSRMGIMNELVIKIFDMSAEISARTVDLLKTSPMLGSLLEASSGRIRFAFSGQEQDVTGLLAKLVHSGVPVTEFYLKKADVEDIFLKIGPRETS